MNFTVIVAEDRTELMGHMQARADQCRRLAAALTDTQAAAALRAMADEVEADIARLRDGGDIPNPMPPTAG